MEKIDQCRVFIFLKSQKKLNFFSKNRKNSENLFLEIGKNSIFFLEIGNWIFRKRLWIKIKIVNELLCHYLLHPNNEF
jgi:hypothetical protein